jgi:Methyltransferase domain
MPGSSPGGIVAPIEFDLSRARTWPRGSAGPKRGWIASIPVGVSPPCSRTCQSRGPSATCVRSCSNAALTRTSERPGKGACGVDAGIDGGGRSSRRHARPRPGIRRRRHVVRCRGHRRRLRRGGRDRRRPRNPRNSAGESGAELAVAEATARAERLGRANVRFFLRDIHHAVDEGAFDAVVCRLVLMWVPDPAAVLRTQAAAVRQPRGRADTRCPTPTALLDKPIVACPPRPGFP